MRKTIVAIYRSQHRLFPNGRVVAANRRFAGVTKEPRPGEFHDTFNGAQVFLGGLRRSFAG